MKIFRRLYNWVLRWADSRWGAWALFILAFTESSFFPVPPDILLIALCLGATKKSFRYAFICSAGSVLGAAFGYGIGMWGWGALDGLFIPHVFSQESFDAVGALYNKYSFWAVFTAGFTPIPYKLFTIAGGVFSIDFGMFMLASIVARSLRFFLIGWLIWRFGAPIKKFIDKYFNWIVIGFTILLVGSFFLVSYL